MVTLTGGGNDEDFADILTDCTVYPANVCSQMLHDAFDGQPIPPTLAANGGSTVGVSQLIPDLVKLYRTIHTDAPNARILVLGYPRILENANTADNIYNSCYSNLFGYYMTTQKSQLIDQVEQYMNEAIAIAVRESKVAEYVPLWEPSASTGAEANITPLQTILPDENLPSFYDAMLSDPTVASSTDQAACSQYPCQPGGGQPVHHLGLFGPQRPQLLHQAHLWSPDGHPGLDGDRTGQRRQPRGGGPVRDLHRHGDLDRRQRQP